MPRPPRIERPGAWHHVTARGNERRAIYRDLRDRVHFCELLEEAVAIFGWRIHAYVLMDNHFHLMVETPEPNLARGMQWLNTSYCVWFNRRHDRAGHLLQGRFKSIVVDPVGWALEVSRYVHLNPVRVARLGLDKSSRRRDRAGVGGPPALEEVRRRIATLRSFRWSSYRAYIGLVQAPAWLRCESVLHLSKFTGKTSKADYRRHVELAVRQGLVESPWEQLRDQVILGTAAFAARLGKNASGAPKPAAGLGLARAPVTWPRVIEAVEHVKAETWQAFRQRHGDWGRDAALYLGRKDAALTLRELGQATDLSPMAAYIAVKRAGAKVLQDASFAEAIAKCRKRYAN